jgi:hypothetical protein
VGPVGCLTPRDRPGPENEANMSDGLAESQPRGSLPPARPVPNDDSLYWRRQQADAEAGAQLLADFLERRPGEGVPIGTTGSDPQPLPVSGSASVTGVPWDAA